RAGLGTGRPDGRRKEGTERPLVGLRRDLRGIFAPYAADLRGRNRHVVEERLARHPVVARRGVGWHGTLVAPAHVNAAPVDGGCEALGGQELEQRARSRAARERRYEATVCAYRRPCGRDERRGARLHERAPVGGDFDGATHRHLLACSTSTWPSGWPTRTRSAVPRNRPVSTTPGIARRSASSVHAARGSASGVPRRQSTVRLPLSEMTGRSSTSRTTGSSPSARTRRRTSPQANGTTSIGIPPRVPSRSTSLSRPTRITWLRDAAA